MRLTRRSAMSVAGLALLSGCARAGRPAAQAQETVLHFAPWAGWLAAGPRWQTFVRTPLAAFERSHRGLRVEVVGPVDGGRAIPQLLAGTAPDVFSEFDIVPYITSSGLVADLRSKLARDNIPMSTWSAGQMRQFETAAGLWFLPNYLNVAVIAVNLADLDARGIPHPDPGWTIAEAERLFRAATWDAAGRHHYGFCPVYRGVPYRSSGPLPNADFALEIFGGRVMDASRTRCLLGGRAVVRGVRWWQDLFASGVATGIGAPLATPWAATFVENRNNHLLRDAQLWGSGRWAFLPIPEYPAGRLSWMGSEGYAISAQSRAPEAAWALLHYLAVDPAFQRYGMRVLLKPPSILALWPEMTAVMEAVVPGFRGRGLHWYAESAARWGRAGRAFKYAPENAMAMINGVFDQIGRQQADPAVVLPAVAKQVDALQAEARRHPPPDGARLIARQRRSDQRLSSMFAAGRG